MSREGDGGHDVVGIGAAHDCGGSPIDHRVENAAHLVVLRVLREHERPVQPCSGHE